MGLVTFGFSTIIGWCYSGEKAVEHLFGRRAVMPYRMRGVVERTTVSHFSDAAKSRRVGSILVALLLRSGVMARATREIWKSEKNLRCGSCTLAKVHYFLPPVPDGLQLLRGVMVTQLILVQLF